MGTACCGSTARCSKDVPIGIDGHEALNVDAKACALSQEILEIELSTNKNVPFCMGDTGGSGRAELELLRMFRALFTKWLVLNDSIPALSVGFAPTAEVERRGRTP
jgi:hypothetical protein